MTKANVTYLMHTDDDATIAQIARVSFDKLDKKTSTADDVGLIFYLIFEGHTSPFRHPTVRFLFDVPLDVFAQMSTHKVGVAMLDVSFNSKSHRYVSPSEIDEIEFREAVKDKKQGSGEPLNLPALRTQYNSVASEAWQAYTNAIDSTSNNVAAECARRILPQATMTRIVGSGSLCAWLNFLELRNTDDTQAETRVVAAKIRSILKKHYPATMFAHDILCKKLQRMKKSLRDDKKNYVQKYMQRLQNVD